MPLQFDVLVWRGEIPESRHAVQFVLADAEGAAIEASATPDVVTTFRSAAKPFQLLPLVERGHADRWGFDDEQLAVMAGSHTGSAHHVALVRGILDRLGLGPDHLVCGYHDPDDPESLLQIRDGRIAQSPLYNNCSGKHAGLLALARSEGWPVEGYSRPEHPVQQLLLRTVAEVCGVAPESVRTAVDGCSVVVFALPLRAMARGYARLASAMRDRPTDGRLAALARIGNAMRTHPRTVEGDGRVSTALMEATEGRLVAKCGAEGLQLVGIPERGLGLALKCVDGATRATGPAIVEVLGRIGVLSSKEANRLASLRRPLVRNAAGLEVGHIEADWRDTRPA